MIELELINIEIPTLNTYYKKFRNRLIISEKGKEFKETVLKIINDLEYEKIKGKVIINVKYGIKRNKDIDNCFKALFDVIKDVLIEDDINIYKLIAEKELVKEPYIKLNIMQL